MLVKLGNMWVDPAQVVLMESFTEQSVTIITPYYSSRTSGDIDSFATIVNNAGQSFGGEIEPETPASAS